MFSGLLGRPVISVEILGGGRNNKVYRLTCENSCRYVGKVYFRHDSDPRDRTSVEFSSLKFLWEKGRRCVPQPIAVGRRDASAVYECIDGDEIPPGEVTSSDIDCAVHFLAVLKDLRSQDDSHKLAAASEACFSIEALVRNIALRLKRLSSPQSGEAQYHTLQKFLNDEFTQVSMRSLDGAGLVFASPVFLSLPSWGKRKKYLARQILAFTML